MKAQRCKGYRDLLPPDMARFRYIEEVFKTCCFGWGYKEIRTPTLEYLHLFTSAGTLTPNMLSRVYSFLDWDGWSGERVVLRPEGTIPAARLYVDNLEKQKLARLFYVENVFSFEESGKESRERWQCGAELMGSPHPMADVELILLALEVLKRLKCEGIELRLSHAGLLRALLQEVAPAQQNQILDQVLNGETGALKNIRGINPSLEAFLPLLWEIKGKSPGFLKNLRVSLDQAFLKLRPSLEEFITLTEYLSSVGCQYDIDIASGRGFEYYTGVVFQFYLAGQKLGGGGRYDDLIPLIGGGPVPASGFALYLDSLMDLARGKESEIPPTGVLIQGKKDTPDEWKSCLEAAQELRKAGYVAELALPPQETSQSCWVLLVQGEGQRASFLLTEKEADRRMESSSLAEIIKFLKGQGVA